MPPLLTPTDLRRGDVLLLEPGERPRLVSEVVAELDGSGYSHAVLLDVAEPPYYVLSANPEHDPLRSGVNAVALATLVAEPSNRRSARVLRPREGGAAAAAHGRRYVESAIPPDPERYPDPVDDPSDFGWEHIVISALAAVARHLEPGSRPRRYVGGVALTLSQRRLSTAPCRPTDVSLALAVAGPADTVRPVGRPAWDCCHFVDHCFCSAGHPLRVRESDPEPRRPVGAVLGCVAKLIEEGFEQFGLDPPDVIPEPRHDDEPDEDAGRLLARLAVQVADGAGLDGVELLRRAVRTELPELVWPPFVSPRLFISSGAFVDLGVLPRGAVPPPP